MPAIIDEKGDCIDVSNYLKADDLGGKEWKLKIEKVEREMLSLPGKPKTATAVAYFEKAKKPLILNTTNLRTIKNMYGKRVADWSGKKITLYETTTKLRGNTVPCIRIREEVPQ